MARISLSAKELTTQAAQELRAILLDITKDGVIEDSEIASLRAWLHYNKDNELPAILHLSAIIEYACLDGHISDDERNEIQSAIEKVLPASDRVIAKLIRKEVEPATDSQISYLEHLGISVPDGLTKKNASTLIEAQKDKQLEERRAIERERNKPSNRQIMVLRFWGMSHDGQTRQSVSVWMDEIYREDPDRSEAWELWKREMRDDGLQGDPTKVLFGCGPEYLRRIKAERIVVEVEKPIPKSSCLSVIMLIAIPIIVLLVIFFG